MIDLTIKADIDWWNLPLPFDPSFEVKLSHTEGRVDIEEINKIFEWLRENITGKWADRMFENKEKNLVGLTFFFNKESDAIAFKMRWIE